MRVQIVIGGLCCLLAVGAAVAFSQDGGGLRGLVNQLGDEEFTVRELAAKRLVDLGEKSVPALEEAVKGHEDAHVRHEAGLILAKIREAMKPERPLRGIETPIPGGVFSGSVDTGNRRLEVERGLDGRVKVTVSENGETTTYRAESLGALRDGHPDIADLVEKYFGNFRVLTRERPLREKAAVPDDRGRLGVWTGEIPESLRYHLGLAEDEGLLVESVVPGSLADGLGVKRLDVITKVNGAKVGGPEGVRTALGAVGPGEQVELMVIRRGAKMTLVKDR